MFHRLLFLTLTKLTEILKMKLPIKSILLVLSALQSFLLFAQPYSIPAEKEKLFYEVKGYCNNQQFQFAYPLLKDLRKYYKINSVKEESYIAEEVDFYYIVCEIKLLHSTAESDAIDFIQEDHINSLNQQMCFYLAHYYYQKNKFEKAIEYFRLSSYDNLTNEQIAEVKFEMAYSYFSLNNFKEAKPLFNEICQITSSKWNYAANYYFGFICYYNKEYSEALNSFTLIQNQPDYQMVVPYYIADILYELGQREEALRYGDSVILANGSLFYLNELNLLLAHLNYEKKNYTNALKYYESFVRAKSTVTKEVLYELSYCYLQTNNTNKAIEGFKKLSNERDSLGQNSMYQLGKLYLSIQDKPNARIAFQYGAYNNSNKTQQEISRFNYAKLSFDLDYQDIALSEIKSFLKDYEGSYYYSEAKEILVSLLAKTNDFKEGLALYDSIKNPSAALKKVYPTLLYGRAVELINDQQLSDAAKLLSKITVLADAIKIFPYAKFWLGEIAYREKRYDDAVLHLNDFLQSKVSSQGEASIENGRYSLGYSYFQKEEYKKALLQFEEIIKSKSPSSDNFQQDILIRSADCNYMLKDYANAIAKYNDIIAKGSSQADYALYQKAMIAGIKNTDEKIRLLNLLKQQFPASSLLIEAEIEIALSYIADMKFSEAIPYLKNILSNKDAVRMKPIAYLKLGLSYYNINDNEEALKNYRQLIQDYPLSFESHEALNIVKDIYVEEGKPNDYIDLLRSNGINVQINEQDSLNYIAAFKKFESNDYVSANEGFTAYLSKYINGNYVLEANYFNAIAHQKNKQFVKAKKGFEYVYRAGMNPFYESSLLELAQIYYFELQRYDSAKKYFEILVNTAVDNANQLEALRGLVRSYYQLKNYKNASINSNELLRRKGISTDDKSIAMLVLGKSQQVEGDCLSAIDNFKTLSLMNTSAWGAESRYEMADCFFTLNNLPESEKAALSVIKETGSYDLWVTKSYILLGDIFMKRKDYFNAKATFESIYKNAVIVDLKKEAKQKFEAAIIEEKKQKK